MVDITIIDKYLEDLARPDPKYWVDARYKLVKLGNEVTEFLIKVLKHKNPVLRARVAKVLGEIGDKTSVPSLIELLKSDKDSYVCSSVAGALGELADNRAIDILIEKLSTKEPKVRKEVSQALGNLKDTRALEPLRKYYESSNGEEKIWATYALIKLGQNGLIHILEDSLREEVLLAAISVAGKLRLQETVPILLELLTIATDVNLRIEVIKTLAEVDDSMVLDKLKKYYEQCTGEERIWVIYALSRLGDTTKTGVVIDVLQKDVRRAAAIALGKIGNKESSEVLIKALKSHEGDVKYRAVLSLQKLGDTKALEPLKLTFKKETENYIKLAIEEAISELEKGEDYNEFR